MMTSDPSASGEKPDTGQEADTPKDGTPPASADTANEIDKAVSSLLEVKPAFSDYANALEQDFDVWSKNERLPSNKALYGLLAKSLRLCELMERDNEEAARLRAEADRYAQDLKLKFNADTHTAVKVARIVFRSDRKQASAYGSALRKAIEAGVRHEGFVAFVMDKGGLEKIRTGKSDSKQEPAKVKGKRAWENLRDTSLGVVSGDGLRSEASSATIDTPVVLLATQLPGGNFAVHAVVQSEAAVYAAYAAHATSSANTQAPASAEQEATAKKQAMAELRAKAARDALSS